MMDAHQRELYQHIYFNVWLYGQRIEGVSLRFVCRMETRFEAECKELRAKIRAEIEAADKPVEPEYREPTIDDAGKEIEIRNNEKGSWDKKKLLGIVPNRELQFVCYTDDENDIYYAWRYARILINPPQANTN